MHRPALRSVHRPRSFTLVELLVVVGIITILIALLLPVLTRARRQFLVLACPIAYIGEDGGLHIVSATGSAEMRLTTGPDMMLYHPGGMSAAMQWSPCGRRIGFNAWERATGREYTVFIDPWANKTWKYNGHRFGGFIDHDRWLENGRAFHRVRSVETGQTLETFGLPEDRRYDTFSPAPPTSGGAFVAAWYGNTRPCIGLVQMNFTQGKTIYSWPDADYGKPYHFHPQVDPTGQWVGWFGPHGVSYIRGLNDGPATPLVALPPALSGHSQLLFCDWTEDSHVLAGGFDSAFNYRLLVLGLDGSLLRIIPTDTPPARGTIAAYRKFGHR